MNKHTPEPWVLFEVGDRNSHFCPASEKDKTSILTVTEESGTAFAAVYSEEDARRIVACVNACTGVDTDLLEAGELDKPTMLAIQENKDLNHRCDELLAALDDITKIKWRDGLTGIDRPTDFAERESAIRALGSAMTIARSAISKAKGV